MTGLIGKIWRGCAAALIAVAMFATTAQARDLTESGKVTIDQVQVAWLISSNVGGGTLSVDGKSYGFSVGGLGVGGIGASSIKATGEVYNLENIADFEGSYIQTRAGFAVIEKSAGSLWLENSAGVYIRLDAERTGVALALGADAVYLKFD